MSIKDFIRQIEIARKGEEPSENPRIYIAKPHGHYGGFEITGIAVDPAGEYIVFTDAK